jgi:hypothetical protein
MLAMLPAACVTAPPKSEIKPHTSKATDLCVADALDMGTDLAHECRPVVVSIDGKIEECALSEESDRACEWLCHERFASLPQCVNGALQQWVVLTE